MSQTNSLSRRGMLGLVGAGALALTGAAACAPSAGGTGAAKGVSDDGVKDFTFNGWSLNEAATKDAVAAIVAGYEKSSGAHVKTVSYPYNDYLNQLLLQVRGGNASGVAQCDGAWLATLAATGKLTDLGKVAAGAGYTDASLALGRVKGTQYGLPWTSGAIGMVGNQRLLDKAGVKALPTTVDDFEAMLESLKALGNGIVPYAAMTKVDQLKDIIPWMWTFGSPVVENGKVTVGDDGSVEAVTWYKKLYDKKLIAPALDRFDARALFGQGKVGVYEDAPVGRGAVVTAAKDKSIEKVLTPFARPVRSAGDKPVAFAWGGVLVVLQGKGSGAAAKFAKYVTSDLRTTTGYFAKTGNPPTTTKALADPALTADRFVTEFTKRVTTTARTDPFWAFPQYAQIEQALATQVQAVLTGKSSPKQAMADARTAMQKLVTS
ncbi:extracellular solute-binding protein [Actinocatenispora rupis]|uniref:Sugar ABC transporter substrate-binding protein n=1 Tax=Actinocatenispora rupis TaxID=519421 RepID=A0A8J3J716_9ACTN|nr:extracellular solute-binding protein [Actinocatenispora rupis]GID11259.1 sugar ABC transporter substrate-binding protein [Actinocatenispora rupis]